MNTEDWEQKYQAYEAHWDHGDASPGLVDFLKKHRQLPKGTVAVPGCGMGHDVRAWAECGFSVHGFDVAPTALAQARKLTKAAALVAAYSRVDFLEKTPPEPFDILFEHTLFCAIPLDQREAYVQSVRNWLKPGGIYLAVNYIVCGPDGPPWPTSLPELWQRFRPHFELLDQWVPRSYPKRCGKEHMLWWRQKQTRATPCP